MALDPKVTKEPPTINQINSIQENNPCLEAYKYPTTELNITKEDSLSLDNSAYKLALELRLRLELLKTDETNVLK
jgi:hypothetical protein